MKFRVTLKNPDVLDEAIQAAVGASLQDGTGEADREALQDNAMEACALWFRYGELLTVEIDTEALTCVVVRL